MNTLDVAQKPAAVTKSPGLKSTDMLFSYVKMKSGLQRDAWRGAQANILRTAAC